MGYRLRFDGVNDYCQFGSSMSIDLGLAAYTFEAKLILNATPTTLGGLLGRSGTSAGFFITSTLTLAAYTSGTLRYQTAANFFLQDGTVHTYRLEHDANGAWRAYRDGVLISSGTFTNTTVAAPLTWIGQGNNSSNSFCSMDLEYLEVTGPTNAQKWDANLSNGTGSILPTSSGTNQASLISFPTDNTQWISFSSGTPWTGTIGKTSLSLVNKSLSINTGQSLFSDKITLTISTKQQSISTGFVATNGKTSLTLSPKQEFINVGYINTLSKSGLALLQKQLSATVGANLPFTGVISKTTYALNGKQFGLALGWNSGVAKSTLPVSNKQESILTGFVNTINEINIPVNGKPLNLQTGTSISYVGTINKGSLNVSGKPLNVVAGTSIPFVGLMQKTSLTLTGKQLGVVRGQVLDLQKQALNIVGKQLSLGDIVYPIIPIERIFTIRDGDRTHYFKQTTTVYRDWETDRKSTRLNSSHRL